MKGQKPEALKVYDVLLTLYPKSGMAYHDQGGLANKARLDNRWGCSVGHAFRNFNL
jgi:hypothetical protein